MCQINTRHVSQKICVKYHRKYALCITVNMRHRVDGKLHSEVTSSFTNMNSTHGFFNVGAYISFIIAFVTQVLQDGGLLVDDYDVCNFLSYIAIRQLSIIFQCQLC